MLIKRTPEDFIVTELTTFEPQEKGPVSVYELRKRKVDTFEAVRRVAAAAKIPLDRIRYLALKDRQAVTTQLISVEQDRIPADLRAQGVKVRYLGRAKEPLTSADVRGNAFEITIRALSERDVRRATRSLRHVLQHGLINYFDDQRFGSLTAGQGMIGRDLVQGDYEAAVSRMLCAIGNRDPLPEKRFKTLIKKSWGNWDSIATKWGNRRYKAIIQHLRHAPDDFRGALSRLPAKERAIHVFAYQSLIWNESVGHYLSKRLPPHLRMTTPYAGGRHVWRELPEEQGPAGTRESDLPATWPLIDHQVELEDESMRRAIAAALRDEKLTQENFEIRGIPGCFFKHYERDLVVRPVNLRLSNAEPDDLHEGRLKQRLTFELPSGSYATLVIKRLYGGAPTRLDRTHSKKGQAKKNKKKKGKQKRKKNKQKQRKQSKREE